MFYNQDPQYDDIQLAQISEMHLEDLVLQLLSRVILEGP